MRVRVKVKSNKKIDDLTKRIRKSSKAGVKVGWFGGTHPSGNTPAAIAKWNNDGVSSRSGGKVNFIPPRPFMTRDFDKYAIKYLSKDLLKKYFDTALLGRSPKEIESKMGEELKDGLQRIIINFYSPPNSPITIAKKGFDDPLVETGRLANTIEAKSIKDGE